VLVKTIVLLRRCGHRDLKIHPIERDRDGLATTASVSVKREKERLCKQKFIKT